MNARHGWPALALALLLAGSGCGGRLVKVTGKVTYKGAPVPSTQVKFHPDDGSRPSTGLTDDDGKFTLKYSRTEPGATRGRHTVSLEYFVGNDEYLGKIPPKASEELRAVIAKYRDPKTSSLHYEVKKNGEFFEIKLE
jgi:hypothetical protein